MDIEICRRCDKFHSYSSWVGCELNKACEGFRISMQYVTDYVRFEASKECPWYAEHFVFDCNRKSRNEMEGNHEKKL